jgi:hypothetical protein
MRRGVVVCACVLTGCGLLSGVDQLTVDDASCATCDAEVDATALDAGSDADIEAASADVGADVAMEATTTSFVCGNAKSPCTYPTEVCCHHYGLLTTNYACVAPSLCVDAGDVPITCGSAADCAAEGFANFECCGTYGNVIDDAGACAGDRLLATVGCKSSCAFGDDLVGCDADTQCSTLKCAINSCVLPDYNACR